MRITSSPAPRLASRCVSTLVSGAAVLFGLAATEAHAASAVDLLKAVPPPPADPATALGWVREGKVVAPPVVALKAAIDAERAAIAVLAGGNAPAPGTAPPAVSADAPSVQGAVVAYARYLDDNSGKQEPAAALAKRTRWIQAAMGTQLKTLLDALKPCPEPCQDPALAAANLPILQKKQALAEQELKLWNSLFADWVQSRRGMLERNQAMVAATADGAAATTPAGRLAIADYRASLLYEVEVALSLTELSVLRSEAIASGRIDASSGASKTRSR